MQNYFTTESLQEPALRNFFLAPLMGLMFLMFLPFIGFYLTAQAIGVKLTDVAKGLRVPASPETGAAYLTGTGAGAKLSGLDEKLSDIEKEVLDARNKQC